MDLLRIQKKGWLQFDAEEIFSGQLRQQGHPLIVTTASAMQAIRQWQPVTLTFIAKPQARVT
jgi:hypothetical protein